MKLRVVEVGEYGKEKGIEIEGWCGVMEGKVLDDEVLKEMGGG